MTWPTSKLIHINTGASRGYGIEDALAARDPNSDYIIIDGDRTGCHLAKNASEDTILDWQDLTLVPTNTIKALHATFLGVKLTPAQQAVIQQVITHSQRYTQTQLEKTINDFKVRAKKIHFPHADTYLSQILTHIAHIINHGPTRETLIEIAATAAAWGKNEDANLSIEDRITNSVDTSTETEINAQQLLFAATATGASRLEICGPAPRLVTLGAMALEWAIQLDINPNA